MTTVRRTDDTSIFRNHEDRILALERAPTSSVFVDTQVLAVAADHVLFSVPTGRTILELTWMAQLDAGALPDPCFAGLLFNGDATSNTISHDEQEYRWNVGIPNDALFPGGTFISIDENTYWNDYGVVSWISVSEASWGRIRFPAYGITGAVGGGGAWNGECAVGTPGGDDSNPGVCAGGRDDWPLILTDLAMIATSTGIVRQQFAAGSWFTLTAY